MTKIYPNLAVAKHGKVMRFAFWLFSLTCLALLLTVVGIQTGIISAASGAIIRQLMGPVLAINIGLLIYLADRDWGVARQPKTDQ